MKSADILLQKLNNKKALSNLVNQHDNEGNTPLHYAARSWPPATIQKLLKLGANIAIKNRKRKNPLSSITAQTLSEYLDMQCLKVDKPLLSIEDYKNDSDEDIIPQDYLRKILEGNEPTFQMNIEDASITFDFNFLIPSLDLV